MLVVDYGIGNLHSVVKALAHEGATVDVSGDPAALRNAGHVVLPGVGAFPDGMRQLEARGLVDALREHARGGRPLLGICLGMQLMLSESDEFGLHRGLDLVPGRVTQIPAEPGLKVPHIGWNRLLPGPVTPWGETLLRDLDAGEMVYFVHSFTAQPNDGAHLLASARYGSSAVTAAIRRDNVTGVQFHPEKSGSAGLLVLRRFLVS